MEEGSDVAEVGAPIEEAPVPSGRWRRRDVGRVLRRHEGGLVVTGATGTVVLPYATTQLFTSELPTTDDDPSDLRGRASWRFRWRGSSWGVQGEKRSSPLAAVCRAGVGAGTVVRLAIARQRLAAGDTVDFARLSATTHELWVHGNPPMPWAEVQGVDRRPLEPVVLRTASRGTFTLADSPVEIADLGVLVRLIAEGR